MKVHKNYDEDDDEDENKMIDLSITIIIGVLHEATQEVRWLSINLYYIIIYPISYPITIPWYSRAIF